MNDPRIRILKILIGDVYLSVKDCRKFCDLPSSEMRLFSLQYIAIYGTPQMNSHRICGMQQQSYEEVMREAGYDI